MAQFEGSPEDFIKFIGGYSRNKVQNITRSHRKKIGKCEDCDSRTKKLDAAHIIGKERPVIISNILKNFIEDGIVKIDLQEFENQFIQSHKPIEDTIKILCKTCHNIYDKSFTNSDIAIEESEEVDLEVSELEEIKIVSDLVLNSPMNKSKAIVLLSKKDGLNLNHQNAVFSNINNTANVWWLEPANSKFKDVLYIILNNSNSNKLYLFEMPKNSIGNPKTTFDQRIDKEASSILIKPSETDFIDKRGFSFNPFLIQTLPY